MKNYFNFSFITIFLFMITLSKSFGLTPKHDENLRHKKHNDAIKYLIDLHFFEDGTGMHLTPNFIRIYEWLKDFKNNENSLIHNKNYVLLDQDQRNFIQELSSKKNSNIITGRWGFNQINDKIIGLNNVPYKKMDMAVLGCIGCHSGKAAGIFIPGLGNKNIDPYQVGKDLARIQKIWNKLTFFQKKSQEYKKLEKNALTFAQKIGSKDLSNQTQGLVATSLIRQWFYHQEGIEMPKSSRRAQVKVPHLWGYGPKRKAGQFCDGYGDGEIPGWGIAVELVGGQSPHTARKIMPKIIHAEEVIEDLLPPKYPYSVDQEMAIMGKSHYQTHCLSCHGDYLKDEFNLSVYQTPKHIPIQVVGTDEDRLKANHSKFNELVETSSLSDLLRKTAFDPGYFAPRLDGIWARFPYLHNGSVPTIWDLLSPPAQRPDLFDLERAGEKDRFDSNKLGLLVARETLGLKKLRAQLKKRDRSIYDTNRIGHSSKGHYFDSFKTLTEKHKLELIEYLKTL